MRCFLDETLTASAIDYKCEQEPTDNSNINNSDSPATLVLRLKYWRSKLILFHHHLLALQSRPQSSIFKVISLSLLTALSLSSLNLLASAQAPIQPDTNMSGGYQPGLATVCHIDSIPRSRASLDSILILCSLPIARLRASRPAKHLHDQLPSSRYPIHQHLGTISPPPRRLRRRHQRRTRRSSRRLRTMWHLLQHHLDRHSIL